MPHILVLALFLVSAPVIAGSNLSDTHKAQLEKSVGQTEQRLRLYEQEHAKYMDRMNEATRKQNWEEVSNWNNRAVAAQADISRLRAEVTELRQRLNPQPKVHYYQAPKQPKKQRVFYIGADGVWMEEKN